MAGLTLTIEDLQVYSYCPQYFKHYISLDKDVRDFNRTSYIESIYTWMFSYYLKTGSMPSYKELDKIWLQEQEVLSLLPEEFLNFSLIKLRSFLTTELPLYNPIVTNLPIQYKYKNVSITGILPVLVEDKDSISLLFFKPNALNSYKNDLHIRYIIHMLEKEFSNKFTFSNAYIYNINHGKDNVIKHSLNKNKLSSDTFFIQLNGLIDSILSSSYIPLYNCSNTSCIFRTKCFL